MGLRHPHGIHRTARSVLLRARLPGTVAGQPRTVCRGSLAPSARLDDAFRGRRRDRIRRRGRDRRSIDAAFWPDFLLEYVLGFGFGWAFFQAFAMRDAAGG